MIGCAGRVELRLLLEICAVAIIYVLTAKIGQTFAIPPGNITPIWIPSGIMLALVIIRGITIWPGIFLGAVLGNAWAYFDTSSALSILLSFFSSFSNGTGDAISAIIAVIMLKKHCGTTNPFQGIHSFIVFLTFGAIVGPLISAFMGVTSLAISGFLPWGDYLTAFFTWWVGDGVGALLIAPAILVFVFQRKVIDLNTAAIEVMLFISGVGVITYLVINSEARAVILFEPMYLIIPLLFWSLLRLGQPVTYVSLLYFFALAIHAAYNGSSSFSHTNQLVAMLQMQGYFVLVSSSIFVVGAMIQEREKLLQKLEDKVSHDSLTHARSRAYFDNSFHQERIRFERYGISFSVVMIDLDWFKKINDQYGHLVGDKVLKKAVNLIQGSLRDTDTLARWGGGRVHCIAPLHHWAGRHAICRISEKKSRRGYFR